MTETAAYSVAEKLREIEREIAIRERFYPEWVRVGRITAARAQKQIDILRAVARDYREKDDNQCLI